VLEASVLANLAISDQREVVNQQVQYLVGQAKVAEVALSWYLQR
jgi:hypothetical protein